MQSDDKNNTNNKEDTDPTESDYGSDKLVNKKRPTKITITITENQIDYNTSTNKKQTENQIENMQNNTKNQVNKHLTNNNQNITQRKKQHSKLTTHQTMRNTKLTTFLLNFLKKITHHLTPITHNRIKTIKIKKNNHKPTRQKNQKSEQSSQNIKIIKETPISQQPQNEDNELDFLSPPVISKTFTSITPDTINTSRPTVNKNQAKP